MVARGGWGVGVEWGGGLVSRVPSRVVEVWMGLAGAGFARKEE